MLHLLPSANAIKSFFAVSTACLANSKCAFAVLYAVASLSALTLLTSGAKCLSGILHSIKNYKDAIKEKLYDSSITFERYKELYLLALKRKTKANNYQRKSSLRSDIDVKKKKSLW